MIPTTGKALPGERVGATRRHPVACGVDVGSTNVKVVLVDRAGTVRARASRPTPRDREGLSIDALVLFDLVEELIVEACGDAYAVHAVCPVGVGEDGVLVDAGLRPLLPALAWFDPRRQGVLRALRARLGDVPPADEGFDAGEDAARTLVGWAWATDQPGTSASRSWVALADLSAVLWTGRLFLSDTLASRTGAWRASTRAWAEERVTASLGTMDLLPAVLPVGEAVGTLRSPGLAAAGVVTSDALVVAGGHDHPLGGWAVDQMTPGAVLDSMGTAEVVVAQSTAPPAAHRQVVDVAPGIRSKGTTVLRVIELARNTSWASQDPQVERWIAALLTGSVRPAPVLESGYFRPGRRGGDAPAYSVDAPRDPLAKASAVLGALACSGRQAVAAVSGGTTTELRVRLAGGWARSAGWVDIKEEVSGYRSIPVAEPEVTAVGAALLAAESLGWDPDPARALGKDQT